MAKNIINKLFFKVNYFLHLLLICLLNKVLSDNCIIESFPDLQFLKSETLLNGYVVMMTTTGIYTFNPSYSITKFEYSYNFTKQQILTNNDIFNAQISQFSNVKEENNYVLCYVKNYVYVLTNKGEFLFYKNIDIPYENISFASLIAYEYRYPFYNFFLIYITKEDINCYFFINNYRLTIEKEEHDMTLYYNNTFDPAKDMENTRLHYGGLSCEIMATEESLKNVLVCFIVISYKSYVHTILAEEIEPDSFYVTNSGATSGEIVVSLSSSVGESKSKAFVCYMHSGGTANCFYYILNEKKFSENKLFSVRCSPNKYSINLYYFSQPKEFIFSCYDCSNNLVMKKLNNNFDFIPTTFEEQKYFGCQEYSSYSIFYLLNIKEYITIAQCKCNNDINIRLFLIVDNCNEFNKTQLYVMKDKTLETSNFNEINESEYIIKTNEILKNTDNYEQSKSDKIQNATNITFLTDLKQEKSNVNTLTSLTDYFTSKNKQMESIANTENIEISKGNNYTDNKMLETNTQSLEKSTYYHSENIEISSYSTNLIKDSSTSSNLNNKMTDSNSEAIEKGSNLSSEIAGKISDFNSQISTEKKFESYKEATEKIFNSEKIEKSNTNIEIIDTNSRNEEKSIDYLSNSLIDSNSNFNNIGKKTNFIEPENIITENEEIYEYYNIDFNISPQKCLCGEKLSYLLLKSNECINFCNIEQLLDRNCQIDCVFENNYNSIRDNVESIIYKDDFNDNEEIVIAGNNVICDILTSNMEHKIKNISYIDFGECETKLKKQNNIDYLLIVKFDAKLNGSSLTNVQYKVYDPITKRELDLSICSNDKINIDIPMILVGESRDLYQNFSSLGYDILNTNDPFYNDICTTFSSSEYTDVILSDRRRAYYNENLILCEEGCEYSSYDLDNNLVRCKCYPKNDVEDDIKVIHFEKENLSSFFDIKTYANIDVLKCHKLLFSKKGLTKNYGAYLLQLIILLYIIIMLIFYMNYKKTIIKLIVKAYPKYKFSPSSSPPKKYNSHTSLRKIKWKEGLTLSPKKNSKKKKKNTSVIDECKTSNKNEDSSNKIAIYSSLKHNNKKSKFHYLNSTIEISKKNKTITYSLIDEEINSLEYKDAILIDKRTFCQYYCSLLFKKHIILFSFCSKNDYNLIYVKITLFLLSFSLFFSINVLFFTDKTMHKIYETKGIYNLIIQLPKIIYSSIITSVFNLIIKSFALSDKNIIYLKKIEGTKRKNEHLLKVIACLKIKFNIYFVIGLLFLGFCWYYISVFCCVYINSQIILIKDTFLSFGFSLLYPFIIYLIPGLFRIPSLKSKNSPFLYSFSKIIALI